MKITADEAYELANEYALETERLRALLYGEFDQNKLIEYRLSLIYRSIKLSAIKGNRQTSELFNGVDVDIRPIYEGCKKELQAQGFILEHDWHFPDKPLATTIRW